MVSEKVQINNPSGLHLRPAVNMAATINKDMIIADMLKIDPGIAAILMASGMHCIGCPSAQGETLDEAAMVHGMNADELVVNVNEYLAKKEA